MNEGKPKTYTVSHLRQKGGEVFREVEKHGKCLINHANFPDTIFELTNRPRREKADNE